MTTPDETRKIIQLATGNDLLFALCNDQTVWILDVVDAEACFWKKIPPIPQDAGENFARE